MDGLVDQDSEMRLGMTGKEGLGSKQLLRRGLELHQRGELVQAEGVYCELLCVEPDNPDALHLLGVLKGQLGDIAGAIDLIERAVAGNPRFSAYYNNLGNVLKEAGERARAKKSYRRALSVDKRNADAHLNLGKLLQDEGEIRAARRCFARAILLSPNLVEAHMSIGRMEEAAGDWQAAADSFQRATKAAPNYAPAYLMLGRCWCAAGDLMQTETSLLKAIEIDADYADAYFNLGSLEQRRQRFPEAAVAYRRAIALAPAAADAWNNLGVTLSEMGEEQCAVDAYLRAIALKPEYEVAYFNLARETVKAGNERASVELFRKVVELNPKNVGALINLGALHDKMGLLKEAEWFYRTAVETEEPSTELLSSLGSLLARLNDPEGVALLEQIVREQPLSSEAHFNLGAALMAQGGAEAGECFNRAIALNPNHVGALHNLGALHDKLGLLKEAAEFYWRAVAIGEPSTDLLNNLGSVLARQGDPAGIALMREIIRREPLSAEAYFNLGAALLEQGLEEERWDGLDLMDIFRKVIALNPKHSRACHNLGALNERQGRLKEASDWYHRAAEITEPSADLLINLGNVLALQGDRQGIVILEEIVARQPLSAEAHFNLATALLLHGRYEEGWREYEWGRKVERYKLHYRSHDQPQWNGEALNGKTILVYGEQGLGDTMQFVRYIPLVVERGGRVILEVQTQLRRLLERVPGVAECVAQNDPLPRFDVCIPLMSLPRIFNTSLETIPAPLLPAVSARVHLFEDLYRDRYKVGLVWAGNPRHQRDRLRSLSLACLRPLAQLDGVAFTALQTGPAASQIADDAGCFKFVGDLSGVEDFADTAEIVAGLDLVIAIDSAVAHLAGSMGKPVWILVANMPDWRWGLNAERTPWYPTARLFRQSMPGVWSDVVSKVALALREEIRDRGLRDVAEEASAALA
jgi:tetratricopeptide (TPR) repeat protein